MPALQKPFKHKPFEGKESIRLIRILPGEQGADMTCSIDIFNFSFDLAPRYAALSYTWGPPEQTRIIFCDGASLAVTENLFQALHHLQTRFYRPPTQNPDFLWVDAVCINQSDLQEKREQVSLMHSIFRNAQKVIIWLGEETSKQSGLHSNALPPHNDNLLSYLSRSYWTRVWTLQEVILGQRKSILLDYAELDWDYFWSGITSVVGQLGDSTCQPHLQQGLQFYSLTSSMSALNILLEDPNLVALDPTLSPRAWTEFYQLTNFASKLHASDPRDMIFSWLAVASALGIRLPPPDYTKSVDVVFQEAREVFIVGYLQAKTRKSTVFMTISDVFEARQHGTPKEKDSKTNTPLPLRTQSSSAKPPMASCSQGSSPIAFESPSEAVSDHSDSDESLTSQDDPKFESAWHGAVKQLIDENKRHLLRTILDYLGLCQDGRIPIASCGKEQNPSNAENQECNRSGKGTDKANKKQKTGFENLGAAGRYERPNDDDDDLEGRFPRKQQKKPKKDVLQDRYACPYFQRNCQNPQLHGACHGPGFDDVHRLKEHLIRVHYIHQCDRCGDIFTTPELLKGHRLVPAQAVCELTAWEIGFDRDRGFAEAQRVSIARIKRNNTIEPWNGIFKVLFPNDPESSYPPQYYGDSQFTQYSHQFQVFWAQQSHILLPQRLENAPFRSNLAEQELQGILQFINQFGTEMIRSFQHHMLQSASAGNEQHTASGILVPTPNPSPAIEASSLLFQPNNIPAVPNNGPISPFHNPPFPSSPPNPNLTFLGLLNNIAPAAGVDFTWVPPYFPADYRFGNNEYFGSYTPHSMRNASGINPQLLSTGYEHSGAGGEMTARESHLTEQNAGEHDAEGDWEVVS